MRTQLFGRYTAPEMVVLGAVEMILTFSLTLVLLTPAPAHISASSVHPAMISAVTVGFIAFAIGIYRPQIYSRGRSLLVNTLLSAILSFPAVWVVSKTFNLGAYWPVGYDPLRPIKIIVIWCAGVVCIRAAFLLATRLGLFARRVAMVCSGEPSLGKAAARVSRKGFLEISAIAPERATAAHLRAHRFSTLILTKNSDTTVVAAVQDECRRHGITVQSQAEFWEQRLRRIDLTSLDDEFFHSLDMMPVSQLKVAYTRIFDVVTSLLLLLSTMPLMVVVAGLVRLDSAGPILYRQERVGLNHRTFTLLKFRSMRSNAEASGPKWAQQRDPRVTRVGSFMRKTRIDELPQLVNILRGEMSFIGPRPERPHFVEQLSDVIPRYAERARVKPGLTGWAQVNFPYGASVDDARAKLSYDLYYVKNRNVLLDALILISTVRVILLQEGAR